MPETPVPATPPRVRRLARLFTLPALILGVGFCFHTTFSPDVFGKYTWGYFAFLLGWFIVGVPLWYLCALFVFDTQTIKLPRGRVAYVRPRTKIILGLLVVLPGIALFDQLLQYRVRKHTLSYSSDKYHPYLQSMPRAGRSALQTNRAGFRGEEIELVKPAGTYRIFVMGGSTVFCGQEKWEDTHCRILELELRKQYPDVKIEVQNAGADWHTSMHAMIRFLYNVQQYQPDLVIAFHGINDMVRSLTPDDFAEPPYRDDYGHFYGPMTNYVRPHFTAFALLTQHADIWFSDFRKDRCRLDGPYGEGVKGATMYLFPKSTPIEINDWPSLVPYERNLRDFAALMKSKDIALIMGNQPHLYREDLSERDAEVLWIPQAHRFEGERPSVASMMRGMDRFNATSRRVAEELGVGFVDLDASVPKTLEHFYDDVHFTPKGDAAVASALRDHVVKAGLIDAHRRKVAARP